MPRFWSPGDDPYALHKVDNSHWCNPVLADAVINPQIGRLAAQLLDTSAVRLWHEQILMKPAGGRTRVGQCRLASGLPLLAQQ